MKFINKPVISVFILLFLLSNSLIYAYDTKTVKKEFNNIIGSNVDYKVSQEIINPIFIDNNNPNSNWSIICSTNSWCTGSGSAIDPYIIENIIIDGLNTVDPIVIHNSNKYFIIRNSTILGGPEFYSSGFGAGIELFNVQNGEIKNNLIINNTLNGIYLYSSSKVNISENLFSNNEIGARLTDASNNNLTANQFKSNQYGVLAEGNANSNIIDENFFTDNPQGVWLQSGVQNSFTNNNFTENHLALEIDSNNNFVQNNTFSKNYSGIAIFGGNIIIEFNLITFNNNGVELYGFYSNVTFNNFSNNIGNGIIIQSTFNTIQNNIFHSNTGNAMYISFGQNNEIKNNDLHANGVAIFIDIALNNTIMQNSITENNIGLKIGNCYSPWSLFNNITNNIIELNFQYGVYIDSYCNENFIYNNKFDNPSGINAEDVDKGNYWNYTTKGNFWGDYTGSDQNDDNIGDIPYLNYGVIDYYPIWWDGFTTYINYYAGLSPQKMIIGDVNNDGYNDLLIGNGDGFGNINSNNTFTYLLWNANTNAFQNATTKNLGGPSIDIQLGDVNNDSQNDIVVRMESSIQVLFWNTTLNDWNSPIGLSIGLINSYRLVVEDVNNDGYLDITINTDDFKIEMFIWNQSIQYWNSPIYLQFSQGYPIIDFNVGDVNDDGYNDIIGVENFDKMTIFIWNNTILDWNLPIEKTLKTPVVPILVSDINNDGISELIAVQSKSLSIFSWNESIHDWKTSAIPLGSQASAIAVDDINNDQYNDIIYSDVNTNTINILTWNESIQDWNPSIKRSVGTGPYSIDIGDVNDDGKNDIVSANVYDRTLTILYWFDLILTVSKPVINQYFNLPPDFMIEKTGNFLQSSWYTLNNNLTKFFFNGLTGTVNSDAWNDLPDGKVLIKFFLNNSQGTSISVNLTVFKDTIAPVLTITEPQNYSIFGFYAPSFKANINELYLQSSWYRINGISQNISFISVDVINQTLWDLLPNGTVIITFYANDSAGNIGLTEISVNKDILSPLITINYPNLQDVFNSSSPRYNLSIQEGSIDTIWYSISNETKTSINITTNTITGLIDQNIWNEFSDGIVYLNIYANDTMGNIGFINKEIIKDTVAPEIQIFSPTFNQQFGKYAPYYNVSISDLNLMTYWYNFDGGTNISFSDLSGELDQAEWNNLLNGHIKLTFYVMDKAGNIESQGILIFKDSPLRIINIEMVEQILSPDEFYFKFWIYNEAGMPLNNCLNEIWWNNDKLLINLDNLGNGFYILSLKDNSVSPGQENYILKIILNSDGFEQKEYYFQFNFVSELEKTTYTTTIIKTVTTSKETNTSSTSGQNTPGFLILTSIPLVVIVVISRKLRRPRDK